MNFDKGTNTMKQNIQSVYDSEGNNLSECLSFKNESIKNVRDVKIQ